MTRILIIDDDEVVTVSLRIGLQVEGYDVEIASDADEGLARAMHEDFDVVLIDLHWYVGERHEEKGLDVIEQLHRAKPPLPVILMTAYPDSDSAIGATKLGAMDYVIKPGTDEEMGRLLELIRKAAGPAHNEGDEAQSVGAGPGCSSLPVLAGRSRAMQTVYKAIGRMAAKPVTVLIRGETGTGKELVARALHDYSGRDKEKFIVVNCPAIPASLLESELFGHEARAFADAKTHRTGRFEQADGGTIFLDEIGEMDVNVQNKLLRVLDEKTIRRIGGQESFAIDVRIVAATHRDLEAAVQERRFRQDLYYRLNDAVIHLPPLRERLDDIPVLAHHFMKQFRAETGSARPMITEDAIKLLQEQSWRGNVRELKNVIHKALLMACGSTISKDTVQKACEQVVSNGAIAADARVFPHRPLAHFISELLHKAERGELVNVEAVVTKTVKREIYGQAVRLANGNHAKAARLLDVPFHIFVRECLSLGIQTQGPQRQSEMVIPEIPDFDCLRPIGKGGFGEVWLAEDVIGEYRAIKILRGAPSDKEFEAICKYKSIATHDGLVKVMHVGINTEGRYFYYVMDLADDPLTGRAIDPDHYAAKTLKSDMEREGRFSPGKCVDICLSLIGPLDHLHSHNLVHRDIKPANIIFINDSPKLADISLLNSIGATTFAGTPPYFAPEGPGKPAADIYGLGIVLYEMMTGKSGNDWPSLPTNVLTAENALFMKLNKVMLKATAQDAMERYQTARDLRDALTQLQT